MQGRCHSIRHARGGMAVRNMYRLRDRVAEWQTRFTRQVFRICGAAGIVRAYCWLEWSIIGA